jgi:predicted ferric reductase
MTATVNEGYSITVTMLLQGVPISSFGSGTQGAAAGLFSALLSIQDTNRIVVFPTATRSLASVSLAVVVEILSIPSFQVANASIATINSYITSNTFFNDFSAYLPDMTGLELLSLTYATPNSAAVASSMSDGFSCELHKELSLSWKTIDANTIQIRMTLNSPTNWLSLGLIHPSFLMFPADVRHSVFIYAAGTKLGRYVMNGLTASDMTEDAAQRQFSGVVDARTSGGASILTVQYSTKTELDDPELVPSKTNYITWANGGDWPAIHTGYGFTEIDWSKGTCKNVDGVGVSPFIVFGLLLVPALYYWNPLRRLPILSWVLKQPLVRMIPIKGFYDYSIGGLFMVLLFCAACAWVFATSLSAYPELATYVTASGNVCLMAYWVALLPTSKSSLFVYLIGVPFERAIKYHRGVAKAAVVLTVIHLILSAVMYNNYIIFSDVPTYFKRVVPIYGTLALLTFAAMGLLAFEPIRRANYEIFFMIHHLYPLGVVFIFLHVRSAWLGFVPGILLQGWDIGRRLFNFAKISETMSVSAHDDVTQLTISSQPAYRPGSYYFVCIPAVSLVQWHPFSVSNVSDNTVSFHIRALGKGTWTRRLYDAASAGTSLQVAVDGPHGCVGLELPSYNKLVVFVGGIGVTPMIVLLEHIQARPEEYHPDVSVELHWSMRDLSILGHFLPRILALLQSKRDSSSLNIVIHLTRADSKSAVLHDADFIACSAHLNFSLHSGRPEIEALLVDIRGSSTAKVANYDFASCDADDVEISGKNYAAQRPSTPAPSGPHIVAHPCVLICGPAEMTKEVTKVSRRLGIDFHAETFAF